MGFLFRRPPEEKTSNPAALLRRAREGDGQAREEILRDFIPFVLRAASRVAGRYLRLGEDDEASVGLAALNEAIDGFDPEKGASFPAFAATVIRRRVIDHYRREKRQTVRLFGPQEGDGGEDAESRAEGRVAMERFALEGEAFERRDEIERYQRALADFGITWRDLVASSPRHDDARRRAQGIARRVAQDAGLLATLMQRRELPLKALEGTAGASRKTLERQRRYIIAVALVIAGDYPHLAGYISGGLERPAGEGG